MLSTHLFWIRRRALPILLVVGMLVGCTLADQPDASPIPITSTPKITSTTLFATPSAQTQTTPPDLRNDPGPFTDAAWILDGVCFEYLAQMHGERWSWTSQDELNAFFDRVDDSGLCTAPMRRATFDFTGVILVGTAQTAMGCDAAFRLVDVVKDDASRMRTLVLMLDVRMGCPYELVQLFLVAAPRLPDPYTTQIVLELP